MLSVFGPKLTLFLFAWNRKLCVTSSAGQVFGAKLWRPRNPNELVNDAALICLQWA